MAYDVEARAAGPADLPVVQALAEAARRALGGQRGGELFGRHEAHRAPLDAWLRAAVADPAWLVVAASLDGAVLGYGVVEARRLADGARLGIVHDLYVDPDARGVGLGEAAMEQLTAWCRASGCLGIDAVALPGDRATKNFFESQGLTARAIVVHRALEERRPGEVR